MEAMILSGDNEKTMQWVNITLIFIFEYCTLLWTCGSWMGLIAEGSMKSLMKWETSSFGCQRYNNQNKLFLCTVYWKVAVVTPQGKYFNNTNSNKVAWGLQNCIHLYQGYTMFAFDFVFTMKKNVSKWHDRFKLWIDFLLVKWQTPNISIGDSIKCVCCEIYKLNDVSLQHNPQLSLVPKRWFNSVVSFYCQTT